MYRIYTVLLFFVSLTSFGQEQSPLHQLSLSSVSSSRYAPANLGTDFTKFQYAINGYTWFGNTTFNRADLEPYWKDGEEADTDEMILKLKNGKNRGGYGVIIEPLLIGYMITEESKVRRGTHGRSVRCPGEYFSQEVMTLSFGVADRVAGSLVFNGEPVKEFFVGDPSFSSANLAFFGQTNGYYTREWMAGVAKPIKLPALRKYFPGVRYRVGARVKFLQGIAGIHTKKNTAETKFDENGIPSSLDYNFKINETAIDAGFNPLAMNGYGFATDLGLYFNYKNIVDGDINLLDAGFLRFNKNSRSYEGSGSFTDPDAITGDTIQQIFEASKVEGASYTMPYSTQLRFDVGYNIMSYTGDSTRYAHHRIAFTYVQGLTKIGNNTYVPYLSLAYTYNAFNLIEVGTNIAYSIFTKPPEVGFVMGLNLKHVHLAVGSSNLTWLARNYGTGADVFANFTVTF